MTAAQPPVLEYRARVSGYYPQDFDASQLLRLALSLQEDPAGMLQGQQVLSGNVTISVQINYNPVDPQAPRPALRLTLERTQTQVSSDGRSITFTTRATLTAPPVVEEVEGSLEGTLNQQPLPQTRISATVNASRDGQLHWSIILGDGAQANTYLPLLPSLTLPYGWLTASEIPKELLNGLEKTANGSFNAILTLSFENGEELTLQHTSQGLSPQQSGRLIFTSRVSGSHPQDFDASSLLPVAIVLTEQTPGNVQGTATQASVTLNISITYQPSNASASRPATILTLEQQDLDTDSRQITFNSISTLQHPTIAGGLGGRVNEENLPTSQVRLTVDTEVDGQLRWNISVPDGENAQSYLPLLPALALPASWLTAEERPEELRDGFESSGDGNLNATVLLSFPSGEQLRVDIFSPGGVTAAQPPVLEYRARVSGSYPQDFDASQLLRLALSLQEDPAGMLQGQQVLSGNVTISVQINYNPVDPQAPRPALRLTLERTQTQVSSDGRSITFTTRATLTAPAVVEEVEGSLEGTLNQQPLPQTRISATVNASRDGQLDWSIILGDGAQANTYLPLLPSLTLPYGWLTASEIPKELLNGLEKTGNGSFKVMVTLSFENGEELTLQHTSQGLSPQQPGRLIFTSRVSGSHPQDFDASSLLPVAIVLREQTPGNVQGTETQASVTLNISITYQPANASASRPATILTLEQQDLANDSRQITFNSISTLQHPTIAGGLGGRVNEENLPTSQVRLTVDPEVDGQLRWNISVPDGENAQSYLPLLPALALPASWMTAEERPEELRDGFESSGDGNLNATVLLSFPSGEQLRVDIFSPGGVTAAQPPVLEYRARVSGSYPQDFDASQLLRLALSLQEDPAGMLQGQQVLSGNVTISVQINYNPVDPQAPRPALRLTLERTQTQVSSDGRSITFTTRATLTAPAVVEEVEGSLEGTLNQQPLPQTRISATVNASRDGQLDWSIILGDGAQANTYLPLLPSLTLPYGWLTASEIPKELLNGLEKTANGSFNAIVTLSFENGEELTLQHTSQGLSPQQPGRLIFTSRVSGSHPQDFDASSLLPVAIVLTEQTPGNVQGTATQASVTLNISITYQPANTSAPRPATILTLEQQDLATDSRQITFNSISTLQHPTIAGGLGGRVNEENLPTSQVRLTVDPEVDGQLRWNISVPDGENAQSYLPLLPALALPASWLTAEERPEELRDGFESSVDGNLNATVLLSFPSGEQLRVDIFSPGGVTAAQPPVLEYRARVSGSYPQDFDASQLLRLPLSLQEDPAGMLQGQQVLSGNVTISVQINYNSVDPQAPRPALRLTLERTQTQVSSDGRSITFTTRATLTAPAVAEEVEGSLEGTLNQQPLPQTRISATVNASRDGQLDWSIILGDGAQANTYLPLLPSLTLPYGWLTASEIPKELLNGLEKTGNGSFNAIVTLSFENGEELTLQHTSQGLSPQQPGRLIFTSRVSGSNPQDFDASSLLPVAIVLTEQTPGNVQGTATQASVTLKISITYQPANPSAPRPATILTLEQQDLATDSRQITFNSISTLQHPTIAGDLGGRVNEENLPTSQVRLTVDTEVDGQLRWNISVPDGENAQSYLPLLPALALPASWLTAEERPEELRDGFESSGDGNLNATVLLSFPSGEQLRVDIFSPGGVTAAQPQVLEYRARVSGSYPQDFDASQLLRLALSLQEDPAGMLQGQQVLSGNVTISVQINYNPVDPQAPRPALRLTLERTQTQVSSDGRSITFTTRATLTAPPVVEEVEGSLEGTLNQQPLPQTRISATVNASRDGQLDWSIILGDGAQANTYLPLLPSLTLPYGWLTASEIPKELLNGLEKTGNGSFNAIVTLSFENGEELTLQHTSQGLSPQQPDRLIFTSRVSGSHPQDFDASSLLPVAIVLTEQTPGNVQGTATQASVTLNISITYQPANPSAPRPATILTLEQQNLANDSRQITFNSISTLQHPTIAGGLGGRVNEENLPTSQVRLTVDPEVDGQLRWNISVPDGENAQSYLPLLPALALPASWLTAEERPEELRDGFESSGDGNLNATVLLSFPSGEQLRVDIFSPGGVTAAQPPVLEYRARISGYYPQDFDASQLLRLALSLQEDPAGMLQGQQVLSGNVTISVQINYNPVDPQAPRPALRLTLERTQTQVSSDGRSITFTTRATLTTPAVVEEVEGSLEGTLNQQPLPQTRISATVNASRDGQLDWSIILGDGAQANTYLPLLPSLTLPYGWLTASEISKELLNGLEKTGNGSFNAIVTLNFENGEELTLQHTSQGLSPQQPGRLIFTSRVSGSHPQDFDASSLLPVAIVLTEQTPGNVQGTATQASVTLNISITYQPANASAPRPATILTLEQQDLATDSRQITFNSISTLQHPTIAGGLGGRVNEENLPTSQVMVTVDPEVDGQLRWNISVPDGENAQSYLPLLPALALPTSWLTAEERPDELRDGFESSGDGNLNATVLLSFPSGEQLRVDIFSPVGVTAAQPPVLEYRARVSGSYPQDFDASQLLRLALSLQEDPAGMLQGQQVLSGNVTISVQINYNPVDPQAPRPALRLTLERTQTQVSSDGRSITFTTRATLTAPAVVEEVEGSLEGTLNQQLLPQTRISATVNASRDGQLDWSIILGDGAQANTYLPLLPSLTLPYGWLTASEIPKELLNGLEKTGNGSFNAIVTLSFENGEELTLQHTSQGLSPQQPGRLIFTSRVSGSHPQDFDASSLLPVAIVLTEQTPGNVQGTATQASVTLNISITYQPANASASRPATILTLKQQDLANDSKQITFNSISSLHHSTIAGGLGGRVNEENLPTSQVRLTVDPEVDGQLRWNISVPDGENAQSYLPLLPALALPASWLTAEERPEELRDGFESSGDGNLNATVLLSFPSGEQLRVDIFSPGGVTAAQPPVLEYRARVSGSYPQDFDASQLLRLALSLQEDPAGMLQGQQVLSGNVTISVQINYNPVDPQAPRPALRLKLERTQTQVSSDGRSITFTTRATLTAPAVVEEVEGSLEGTLNQQPLPQTQISATVNASRDGQLDWSIILGDGAQANTYLPLLPSLTLPYGWLTASEIPKELLNGLEKTGNGSFNAIVTLSFENGEELTLQHTSQGLSPQQPGRLIFTSRVSGSHPQDFDASSLLPVAIVLTEQTPGNVQGTATQASVTLNISITYQPANASASRPATILTLEQQDLATDSRQITFNSISTLQHPTIAGGLGGRVNEENLPTSQVRLTVDPEVDGQLRWNISVPDGENAKSYLPLLPALALPASWLTAEERPEELRDGFESSGDGNLNATVLLSFPSGEQLRVDIFSPGGVTAAQPPVLEYRARVSGSYPQDFAASQLLRLALSLQEDPAGMLQGQQVLSGNVTISVQINYNPVDPQAPRPALRLTLERTQTQVSSDGRSITFTTRATLIAPAVIEEVEGSLEGTLNQQPLPQTRISSTVNASRDGQLDWSIILGDGAQANTYLPLLPSLTLPYGWLTASEIPKELLNGLEKTANGSFNAIVTLSFENGEELTLQHTSQGLSPQQPGRLIFTSRVSGSHPQDFDASSLLPVAIVLTEQTPGNVQGTATQASVTLNISITYHPTNASAPRPATILMLKQQDLANDSRQITFNSISTLQHPTIAGGLGGRVNEENLPTSQVRVTVDPEVDGQLRWNISVPDGENAQSYLPLLPALALPASWLTAEERPEELRDGFESSGDGNLNATVLLSFPSGEQLRVDIFSPGGVTAAQPPVLEYRARVSGSYPQDFDASQLLRLALSLQEDPVSLVRIEQVLIGNITFSGRISYSPADLESPSFALLLIIEVTDPLVISVDNINILSFTTKSSLSTPSICMCNNLTEKCNPLTGECLDCQLFTSGVKCEICLPGYYPVDSENVSRGCQPCLCPGLPGSNESFSDSCTEVNEELVCLNCREGYGGPKCNQCTDGYYRAPSLSIVCQKCDCSGNIDEKEAGNCDVETGECLKCINNTKGFRCELCKGGYWGNAVTGTCRSKSVMV